MGQSWEPFIGLLKCQNKAKSNQMFVGPSVLIVSNLIVSHCPIGLYDLIPPTSGQRQASGR
jgi:hypothetical protein